MALGWKLSDLGLGSRPEMEAVKDELSSDQECARLRGEM